MKKPRLTTNQLVAAYMCGHLPQEEIQTNPRIRAMTVYVASESAVYSDFGGWDGWPALLFGNGRRGAKGMGARVGTNWLEAFAPIREKTFQEACEVFRYLRMLRGIEDIPAQAFEEAYDDEMLT